MCVIFTRSPLLPSPGAALPPLHPHTGTEMGNERASAIGWACRDACMLWWPTAMPREGAGVSSLNEPAGQIGTCKRTARVRAQVSGRGWTDRRCSPPPRQIQRARSRETASPHPCRTHLKHNVDVRVYSVYYATHLCFLLLCKVPLIFFFNTLWIISSSCVWLCKLPRTFFIHAGLFLLVLDFQ